MVLEKPSRCNTRESGSLSSDPMQHIKYRLCWPSVSKQQVIMPRSKGVFILLRQRDINHLSWLTCFLCQLNTPISQEDEELRNISISLSYLSEL
ncbi:hypothetical protein FKM82_029507 [Ascaphus truei]